MCWSIQAFQSYIQKVSLDQKLCPNVRFEIASQKNVTVSVDEKLRPNVTFFKDLKQLVKKNVTFFGGPCG